MFANRIRLIAAAALFVVGIVLMAVATEPAGGTLQERMLEMQQSGPTSPAEMRARVAYIATLEKRYQPYAAAFLWANTTEQREAIKRRIDQELAELDRISERGLAAALDTFVPALASPHLILLALSAALALKPLAFVLAAMAVFGILHQPLAVDVGTYVGSPSEYFLGALLAALLLGVLAWFGVALWERSRAAPT